MLLQRPLDDAGGRHRYFLAVQLLDVVGLGLESHSNNTSNYSIAQLLFLKWLTHDDSMTQEVKMMAMDGQMAIIFLEIFALCD